MFHRCAMAYLLWGLTPWQIPKTKFYDLTDKQPFHSVAFSNAAIMRETRDLTWRTVAAGRFIRRATSAQLSPVARSLRYICRDCSESAVFVRTCSTAARWRARFHTGISSAEGAASGVDISSERSGRNAVRAAGRHVSIDNDEHPVELAAPSETAAILDARWLLARRQAAVEHVRTKTALSEKSKAIYRAYVLEERPIEGVSAAFGVPNNTVSQTKTRVARMIAAHEALLGE